MVLPKNLRRYLTPSVRPADYWPDNGPQPDKQDAINFIWDQFVEKGASPGTDIDNPTVGRPFGDSGPCFLGCLLPDHLRQSVYEGTELNNYQDLRDVFPAWFARLHEEFMLDLENAHDRALSLTYKGQPWRDLCMSELASVARKWGLTLPEFNPARQLTYLPRK